MTRTTSDGAAVALASVERRFPDAIDLAELTATAVVIEPELLRAVRLVLAKQCGADAEGDLWVSEIVDTREATAITIVPAVAELLRMRLRARLQSEKGLTRRLAEVLESLHADLPESLRFEERLRWITVTEPEDRIVTETEPLLAGALAGVLDSSRNGLARWAPRALRRMPGSIIESPSAARLAQVLIARGSMPANSLPAVFGSTDTLDLADVSDLVDALGTTALGVRRTGDVLELGDVGAGGEAINVPSTEPRLVEVDGVTQRVASGERHSHVVGWGPVDVRTAAGDVYTLDPEPPFGRTLNTLCARVEWPGGMKTVGVVVDNELMITVSPLLLDSAAVSGSLDVRVQIPTNQHQVWTDGVLRPTDDPDTQTGSAQSSAAAVVQTDGRLTILQIPGLHRPAETALTYEAPAGGLWLGRGFTSNGEMGAIAGRFPESGGPATPVRVSAQVETVAGSPVYCRDGLVAGVIERLMPKTEDGQQAALIGSARIRRLINSHQDRQTLFISYSFEDADWVNRFKIMLQPAVHNRRIDLWADDRIAPGDSWRSEIEAAISRSSVALLLVSPAFLASRFIMDTELPALVAAGARLVPVLVRPCLWQHVPVLTEVQWAHNPGRDDGALVNARGRRRDELIVRICDRLLELLANAPLAPAPFESTETRAAAGGPTDMHAPRTEREVLASVEGTRSTVGDTPKELSEFEAAVQEALKLAEDENVGPDVLSAVEATMNRHVESVMLDLLHFWATRLFGSVRDLVKNVNAERTDPEQIDGRRLMLTDILVLLRFLGSSAEEPRYRPLFPGRSVPLSAELLSACEKFVSISRAFEQATRTSAPQSWVPNSIKIWGLVDAAAGVLHAIPDSFPSMVKLVDISFDESNRRIFRGVDSDNNEVSFSFTDDQKRDELVVGADYFMLPKDPVSVNPHIVPSASAPKPVLVDQAQVYAEASAAQRRRQRDHLIELVTLLPTDAVMEVGTGTGRLAIEIGPRVHRVHGIDPSPDMVRQAEENARTAGSNNVTFEVADLLGYDAHEVFDVVLSNSTMHWILPEDRAYQQLYRMLRSGGRLAIHQGGQGNYRGLWQYTNNLILNLGYGKYFQAWTYPTYYPTVEDYRDLLERVGFVDVAVESVETDGSEYPNLIQDFSAAGLLPYLKQLPEIYRDSFRAEWLDGAEYSSLDLYTHRLYAVATRPVSV